MFASLSCAWRHGFRMNFLGGLKLDFKEYSFICSLSVFLFLHILKCFFSSETCNVKVRKKLTHPSIHFPPLFQSSAQYTVHLMRQWKFLPPPEDNNVVDRVSNLFLAVCYSLRDFICVSLCSNFVLGRQPPLEFVSSHFAILIFSSYTRVLF